MAITEAMSYGLPTVSHVAKAMGRLREERERMSAALEVARGWELNVMAGREAVHQKILELQR